LYGALYKKVHGNQFLLLKQPVLYRFVIFMSFVTLIILSTYFLIHSEIFVDSHRNCGLGEAVEVGYFWCKMGIGRIFLSYHSIILYLMNGYVREKDCPGDG